MKTTCFVMIPQYFLKVKVKSAFFETHFKKFKVSNNIQFRILQISSPKLSKRLNSPLQTLNFTKKLSHIARIGSDWNSKINCHSTLIKSSRVKSNIIKKKKKYNKQYITMESKQCISYVKIDDLLKYKKKTSKKKQSSLTNPKNCDRDVQFKFINHSRFSADSLNQEDDGSVFE